MNENKKGKIIKICTVAGALCLLAVGGTFTYSAIAKEEVALTEKEYKSSGTFSVKDLKWSEDVSKYNPRFADGMTSITYKANGEYMETIVLSVGEEKRKYDVVVKVEGVVEPTTTTTTVPTTTIPTTTVKPTEKTTTKTTAKAASKKTTAKKVTSTTKKKVVSTTEATTKKVVEDIHIGTIEEAEEMQKKDNPNHPLNKPADTFGGWDG